MLSIVMPSFNHEEFLAEAVESVFDRAHAPLELVVIDGGSTDGTQSRLAELAGRWPGRLRWKSAPDSGPAAAVNLGVREARGEVVGWLNADDKYAAGALTRAVRHLQARPDQVMVYGEAEHIAASGRVLSRYPTASPSEALEDFTAGCFICQPSVFFRRQTFLELGGLDETLSASFDFDLWLRMFLAFPNAIGFIPEVMAYSRLHANTITARQRDTVALEGLKVLRRHLNVAPPDWLFTRVAERCHEHPFNPPQTCLRTALESLVTRAAPWLDDAGMAMVRERIAADRSIALATPELFATVWPDAWADALIEIRVLQPTIPATFLRLQGHYEHPNGAATRLEALAPDGDKRQLELRYPGSFEWLLPLSDARPGARIVYRISANRSFVPADCDPASTDQRSLSWQLYAVELIRA